MGRDHEAIDIFQVRLLLETLRKRGFGASAMQVLRLRLFAIKLQEAPLRMTHR
jgi:hypothetical protein